MDTTNFRLSVYCTSSDFVKATETISEDLSIVGLPPIVKYDETNPVLTVVSLVNTTWALLQQRQQLVDGKRDLEQQITTVSQELLYLKQKQQQLESSVHHNEDELIKKRKLLLIKTQDELESAKKIKLLKKEILEMNQQLKNKEWQFKHDYKRQKNEIASLQCKLRGILSKEKGDKWKGPIDSSVGRTSFTSNEELFKKCIRRLENNIQQLVKENLELRKLLDNVSLEMVDLLKARKTQKDKIA